MIIQKVTAMCTKACETEFSPRLKQASFGLDWVTAAALLVIGLLGALNVIPVGVGIAYGLLGAGIVYTIAMALQTSAKISCDCKEKSQGIGSSFSDKLDHWIK